MSRFRVFAVALLGLSGLAGCTAMAGVSAGANQDVEPLMASQHCGFAAPGLILTANQSHWRQLSSAAGTQLPPWPEQAGRRLLIANLGQKPTGGYGLDFKSATLTDRTLLIEVAVRQPASDAMVTQALTTPCLVLELPDDGWDTLVVEGADPFPVSRQHP